MVPQLDYLEIYSEHIRNKQQQNESDTLFHSHSQTEAEINDITISGIEVPGYAVGEVVPSIEAVKMLSAGRNIDLRPRLVDSSTGEPRLLDSGAQISATKRRPEDKLDTSMNLVAVNGSRINTYGIRNLEVKINRKKYTIPAMVCDIKQDILGADFIDKYRLGLEWDDFDQTELFIVDKRADIRAPVKIVTVPNDTIRTHHIEEVS